MGSTSQNAVRLVPGDHLPSSNLTNAGQEKLFTQTARQELHYHVTPTLSRNSMMHMYHSAFCAHIRRDQGDVCALDNNGGGTRNQPGHSALAEREEEDE